MYIYHIYMYIHIHIYMYIMYIYIFLSLNQNRRPKISRTGYCQKTLDHAHTRKCILSQSRYSIF